MTNCASIFSQVLSFFNRSEFADIVRKHKAEKHAKGFNCWDQFVAMTFCQLAKAHSLREIQGGLSCCLGKLKHLGVTNAPKRSTLSYANKHRPWEVYRDLFYQLLERCQTIAAGKKRRFRFKNKLLSMDATIIDLCLTMFPWAEFRTTKGAVKLHLLLDHDGYLPTYVHITNAKTHEVNIARRLVLPKGSIIAVDRGFNDYSLFAQWTENDVYFVTRMKENTVYREIEARRPPRNSTIISDQIIRLTGSKAAEKYPFALRRIAVWDPDNQKEIVLLTNHLDFGATTISQIYKERWQIEIFFKALKQNLKVKTFIGTSPNALKIQIWTALIAILVLKFLQLKSKFSWSLSNLVAMLHWNLFTYRNLWVWIDNPYETPPIVPEFQQLSLNWTADSKN